MPPVNLAKTINLSSASCWRNSAQSNIQDPPRALACLSENNVSVTWQGVQQFCSHRISRDFAVLSPRVQVSEHSSPINDSARCERANDHIPRICSSIRTAPLHVIKKRQNHMTKSCRVGDSSRFIHPHIGIAKRLRCKQAYIHILSHLEPSSSFGPSHDVRILTLKDLIQLTGEGLRGSALAESGIFRSSREHRRWCLHLTRIRQLGRLSKAHFQKVLNVRALALPQVMAAVWYNRRHTC